MELLHLDRLCSLEQLMRELVVGGSTVDHVWKTSSKHTVLYAAALSQQDRHGLRQWAVRFGHNQAITEVASSRTHSRTSKFINLTYLSTLALYEEYHLSEFWMLIPQSHAYNISLLPGTSSVYLENV